jgi:hypothetical protein
LQIGHFRNGQRHSGALHPNVDLGTNEVEGSIVGTGDADEHQQQETSKRKRRLAGAVGSFIPGECRVTQETILTDFAPPFPGKGALCPGGAIISLGTFQRQTLWRNAAQAGLALA